MRDIMKVGNFCCALKVAGGIMRKICSAFYVK